MVLIGDMHEPEMGTRLKRAGLLFVYAALILLALFMFARRWSAFALLVPGIAVVVAAVFLARIVRVLRFRQGERRQLDRRHTDRRDLPPVDDVREPESRTLH
jgi:O-antigen ligase